MFYFNDSKTASLILPDDYSYSMGNNTSKLPKKEQNVYPNLEQDMTIFDYLESKLLEPLEKESLNTNSGSMESSR